MALETPRPAAKSGVRRPQVKRRVVNIVVVGDDGLEVLEKTEKLFQWVDMCLLERRGQDSRAFDSLMHVLVMSQSHWRLFLADTEASDSFFSTNITSRAINSFRAFDSAAVHTP